MGRRTSSTEERRSSSRNRRSGGSGGSGGGGGSSGQEGVGRRRRKTTTVVVDEEDPYDDEAVVLPSRTKSSNRHHYQNQKAKVSDYSDNSPSNDDSFNYYDDDDHDNHSLEEEEDAGLLGGGRRSSKDRKTSSRQKKPTAREEARRKRRLRASSSPRGTTRSSLKDTTSSSSSSFKRYMYSAISATFFFMLFREMGLMGEQGSGTVTTVGTTSPLQDLLDRSPFLRHVVGRGGMDEIKNDSNSNKHGHQQAALLAGTSTLGGIKSTIKVKERKEIEATMTKEQVMEAMVGKDGAKYDDDESSSGSTSSTTTNGRPIMYTFFEWIPIRHRGTQMSDDADISLMKEWKAAWSAAGWEPRVLTLEDAKKHEQYGDYAPQLNKIQMLGVDGMGGNVIYNQLCFLRWLAMAVVGGGFMADYDVFPISKAPSLDDEGNNDGAAYVPFGGNFTVYSKIKNSQGAGIPCLMSGRTDEWTRMAFAILENGLEHANENTKMWSDMLALIDMRHDSAYHIHDVVAEGQDVLKKHGWSSKDCEEVTSDKMAIHFSHEALRKGYIRPGETAEDRPYIIRRFLAKWHKACNEEVILPSSSSSTSSTTASTST